MPKNLASILKQAKGASILPRPLTTGNRAADFGRLVSGIGGTSGAGVTLDKSILRVPMPSS